MLSTIFPDQPAGGAPSISSGSSGGVGSLVGSTVGSVFGPAGTLVGGLAGTIVEAIIPKGKTPRLSWSEQNDIARPLADDLDRKIKTALQKAGMSDKIGVVHDLIRSYAVARFKTLDLATRSTDTRKLVQSIGENRFPSDHLMLWEIFMIELDNVSRDKSDASARVQNVINSIISPALADFDRQYAPKTSAPKPSPFSGDQSTLGDSETEQGMGGSKILLWVLLAFMAGIIVLAVMFGGK